MAHQDVAEDELVLILHIQAPALYGLQDAVQVGAANLVDPFASKNIIENLPKVMEKYGINDLSQIIGGAH